jgi:hypothetical protein
MPSVDLPPDGVVMVSEISVPRFRSPGVDTRPSAAAVARVEDDDGLSPRGALAASAVAAMAVVVALAPIAVAALALLAPNLLDHLAAWLVGVSLAFTLVAAGRVPAAALLALVMSRRLSE